MEINNYFDFRLIIKLSIAFSVSVVLALTLGKVASDLASDIITKFLKTLGSRILMRFSPLKFIVGFPYHRIEPNRFTYDYNIVSHIHVDFKPLDFFDNYTIPIYIFFHGKLYQETLEFSVKGTIMTDSGVSTHLN